MEPPNNGHVGDEHFVHCSEVVPSSEVEMYGQLMEGGKQFVHCREVVLLSECPLSEVLLYSRSTSSSHNICYSSRYFLSSLREISSFLENADYYLMFYRCVPTV